jgi:hypothetical protein
VITPVLGATATTHGGRQLGHNPESSKSGRRIAGNGIPIRYQRVDRRELGRFILFVLIVPCRNAVKQWGLVE